MKCLGELSVSEKSKEIDVVYATNFEVQKLYTFSKTISIYL